MVSSVSRCKVPILVYLLPCWALCRVSVMAWVSSGWALISMKVWCSVPAAVMACWKRTGLRMLVAQCSASNTGRVSRSSYVVEMIGMAGVRGARSASSERIWGCSGIHGRVVRGHFDIDPAGEAVLRAHRGDQSVDLLRRSGDHSLARRVIDRQRHLRVVGDQRLGRGRIELQQRHAALSGQRRHQLRAGRGHPQPLGGGQCSGHHCGGHLAHGVADHHVGVHPVGTPQSGQRQLHADQAQLDLFDADQFLAAGDHVVQRESGLLDEHRFQFGDRLSESGLVGQQLAAHARPLRSAPGVDKHRARPAARLRAGPPPRRRAGRRPAPATRPPPGRGRGRPRCRTWPAGSGDD